MIHCYVITMRPPRAQSPKYGGRLTRHESLRQRCPDQHTNEIIHFVRELQFERQNTFLPLQKKAPLPGIGQSCFKAGTNEAPLPSIGHSCFKAGTNDSGFLERGTDSTDSEDDSLLDNEIARTQRRVINPRLDPFVRDMLTCPRTIFTSNDHAVLSRSLPNNNINMGSSGQSTPTRVVRQDSFIKHKNVKNNTRNCRDIPRDHSNSNIRNQLPPLSRDDIPERPSAPSPSQTPPSSDYDFIQEEPVEFLDLS